MFSVGTWNVARKTGPTAARQLSLLKASASVWVLTEPSKCHLDDFPQAVKSIDRPKPTLPWIAIVGEGVRTSDTIRPTKHSVAAVIERDGIEIAVLGTVLPWRSVIKHAPELVNPGEDTVDAVFERILGEQRAALAQLKEQHGHVIWAGDFNQSLFGPNTGGSTTRRKMLNAALRDGLVPFNAELPHICAGLSTIDLICGTSSLRAESVACLPESRPLSDHLGYVAKLGAAG